MNTNTREFGSKARDAAVAARVQRDYPASAWRADMAANRSRNLTGPNAGTVTTLLELAASRTPWVTSEAVELFASTNTAEVVAARIDWLERQPRVANANSHFAADGSLVVTGTNKLTRPERKVATGKEIREVPEGRYAIGPVGATKFYRVDCPTEGKWKGYTFVKVQAGDDLFNIRQKSERLAVLAAIAEAGVEASMLRYGRELGHCGHCGRTLTNPESLERGIGPVCYGKMGF